MTAPAVDVTVVIPVYNRPSLVREAVASVLEQDVDAEIVIVDDGSTDDTWGAVQELAAELGPGVRAVQRANGGPAAARNTGVASATTQLVTFLDSDDLMAPGRLAAQVAAWSAHPDEDVVVIGREEIEIAEGVEPPRHIVQRIESGETTYHTSVLLSCDQFVSVGGFDEELRFAEDVDFVLRLEEAGNRLIVLDDVMITRRILGDNEVFDPAVDRSLFLLLRRRAQRARGET